MNGSEERGHVSPRVGEDNFRPTGLKTSRRKLSALHRREKSRSKRLYGTYMFVDEISDAKKEEEKEERSA